MSRKGLEPDKEYLGIPRKEIPWFPEINEDKCSSCYRCVDFCKLKVYGEKVDYGKDDPGEDSGPAQVKNPYNCVVGCIGCQSVCPESAIDFPSTKVIDKVRKKYGV